jgi:hypothetical protein
MGQPDRFRPPVCRRQERRPIPAAGDVCADFDLGSKAGCRHSDGQAVCPSLDVGRRLAREDRRISQPAPLPPARYAVGAYAKENATDESLRGIEPRSTLQRAHARGTWIAAVRRLRNNVVASGSIANGSGFGGAVFTRRLCFWLNYSPYFLSCRAASRAHHDPRCTRRLTIRPLVGPHVEAAHPVDVRL